MRAARPIIARALSYDSLVGQLQRSSQCLPGRYPISYQYAYFADHYYTETCGNGTEGECGLRSSTQNGAGPLNHSKEFIPGVADKETRFQSVACGRYYASFSKS